MDILNDFRTFLLAERRLEPTTITAYMSDVDGFLNYATAAAKPFSGALAEAYLHSLESEGRRPGFLRHVRMSIRRFYHWLAVHQKVMDVDEIEKIDPIRDDCPDLPTLTPEEVQKLMDTCEGEAADRNRMMIRLLYETAMRVSEMCDLDLNSVLPGMKALRITAKGRVDRVIPLQGECFEALQDYVRRWRTRHAVATPAMFVNEKRKNGQRIKRRRVSKLIGRLAAKVGVAKSSAHTLRRSKATQMLGCGVRVEDVQLVLGHDSIDATQRYAKASPAKLRAEYAKYFHSPTGGPELA